MPSRRRTLQALASLASLAVWPRRAAAQDHDWPAAQWESPVPSDSGWNPARLQEAGAVAQRLGSDAVLVVHHGQLLWVDRVRDIMVVRGTDHTRWRRASPQLGQLSPLLDRIFAAMPT